MANNITTMQGLTPTITITVPNDTDLTEAANVYPSIKQGKRLVRPVTFDVAAHQVGIYLSQEETLSLVSGGAEVQLNWTYSTGQRGATIPVMVQILPNQILEVLE